jgi:hypothetical protein
MGTVFKSLSLKEKNGNGKNLSGIVLSLQENQHVWTHFMLSAFQDFYANHRADIPHLNQEKGALQLFRYTLYSAVDISVNHEGSRRWK